MARQKINITDFSFKFLSAGHYKVEYQSPATGRRWSALVRDMPIIDATKNSYSPKQKDLETLKYICKNYEK